MTLLEIKQRLEDVESIRGDDEAAHSSEDAFYADFIEYVSLGADRELAEKAKEVLKSSDIDFCRWCA